MALENLKSVFSDIKKFQKSDLTSVNDVTPDTANDIINKPISLVDRYPISNAVIGELGGSNVKISPLYDLNNIDKTTVFSGKSHLFDFGNNFTKNLGNITGIIQNVTPQIPTQISEILTFDVTSTIILD